jgi:hypothetical protein
VTVPCLACGEEMEQVDAMQVHPTCEISADIVTVEMFDAIRDSILNQPRSLQTKIGPSEMGHPCDRRIAHKLAGTPEVNARGVAWKPYVGTAIHEQMANIFAKREIARWGDGSMDGIRPRYHVEERVTVGQIGGVDHGGSTDLFDAATGIVFDWKFTTVNQIKRNYKRNGPGKQYRKQAHLYGKGWEDAGFQVLHVAIVFLTRDGEYADRYVWSEPYDRSVAEETIAHVNGIKSVVDMLGPAGPATYDPVSSYCQHCPFYKVGATNLEAACPGDPTDADLNRIDMSDPFGGGK